MFSAQALSNRLLKLPDAATNDDIVADVLGSRPWTPREITKLLGPLARAKRSELLRQTLDRLKELGLQSNVVHHNLLLSSFERLSHWQQAIYELDRMNADELEATPVSMSSVASACTKAAQWQRALEVFHETRLKDAVCFNVAISACARGHRWASALRLLRSMPDAEVSVDAISYNAAISACPEWQISCALLAEMKEVQLEADAVSYGAVYASGLVPWDYACQLLQSMQEDAIQAGLINYNAAIAACSAAGRWTESLHLLMQISQPDVVSVGSAVMACQKLGQWEMALSLLHLAERKSIDLSLSACNAAISACEKAAQWNVALALLESMEESTLNSDAITYNAAIGSCDKGLQWQLAVNLLQRMNEMELEQDRISFYTAIHACESCGQWSMAQELLSKMLQEGIQDGLGADNLNRRDYLHDFQAGDPIDCFKHVVLLSFWQSLTTANESLTFLDAHAGAGVYDLQQGAATFHRNYQDGVQHLFEMDMNEKSSGIVQQFLQTLRRFNEEKATEGQLRFYLGSSGLLKQWLRPQDQAIYVEASESMMRHLKLNLEEGDDNDANLTLLQTDSYRWLLNADILEGKMLVLLDPPYDSVHSYHVWNLFIMKHLRHRWPSASVALWYPIIDDVQTQNFHQRLAGLGEDVLVAEIQVQRPYEEQQSHAGMALLAAPEELQSTLECEVSALAKMLASSPCERNVRSSVFWIGRKPKS
ncbi:unnamed protein product [Durusdinium trenchii]|uniref:Pentatricopeptide repeat-containing protein-mitochondrial domain-containing protein n=1 Tax=Durusdinium trenchii TaxID=1381693 RepID=A0ABP0RSR2_9DINO